MAIQKHLVNFFSVRDRKHRASNELFSQWKRSNNLFSISHQTQYNLEHFKAVRGGI
jgi:hypothetical protein